MITPAHLVIAESAHPQPENFWRALLGPYVAEIVDQAYADAAKIRKQKAEKGSA